MGLLYLGKSIYIRLQLFNYPISIPRLQDYMIVSDVIEWGESLAWSIGQGCRVTRFKNE